jgi:hypothetical protein
VQLYRNMTLSCYSTVKLDIIQTFIFAVAYRTVHKICQQREVISQEGAKIGLCFRKFHTRYPKHRLRLGNIRFWTDTIYLQNGVYTKECRYFIECIKTGHRNCGIQIVSFFRLFVCHTYASFVVRHTSNHIIFLLGYNYSSG